VSTSARLNSSYTLTSNGKYPIDIPYPDIQTVFKISILKKTKNTETESSSLQVMFTINVFLVTLIYRKLYYHTL